MCIYKLVSKESSSFTGIGEGTSHEEMCEISESEPYYSSGFAVHLWKGAAWSLNDLHF